MMFTVESFGTNCPTNWEEICEYLNEKIEDGMDNDDMEEMWETYCNGGYADAPEAEFEKGGDVMQSSYIIGATEYDLYQAASGDWCVSVDDRDGERADYRLGSREKALEFILADYECK